MSGRKPASGFLESDERVTSLEAGTVDEAINKAWLRRGEIRKGEDRGRDDADADAAVLDKEPQGSQGLGLWDLVEGLKGEVGFGHDQIGHENLALPGELLAEEVESCLVLVQWLSNEKSHDHGGVQTGGSGDHLPLSFPVTSFAQPALIALRMASRSWFMPGRT